MSNLVGLLWEQVLLWGRVVGVVSGVTFSLGGHKSEFQSNSEWGHGVLWAFCVRGAAVFHGAFGF